MKLLVTLWLITYASSCSACYVAPPEQYTPPEDLILRTNNIVLAKVVRAEIADRGQVLYTFDMVKTLKGSVARTFNIIGSPAIWEGANHNFDHHFDAKFWSNPGGRVAYETDCQIRPGFNVGGTYLIFLDKPYHAKGFEIIIRTHGGPEIRDKWLQYVELRTGA